VAKLGTFGRRVELVKEKKRVVDQSRIFKALQEKRSGFGSEGESGVGGFSEAVEAEKVGLGIGVSRSELKRALEDGREGMGMVLWGFC